MGGHSGGLWLFTAPGKNLQTVEDMAFVVVGVGLEGDADADLVVVCVELVHPVGSRALGLLDALPVPAVVAVVDGFAAEVALGVATDELGLVEAFALAVEAGGQFDLDVVGVFHLAVVGDLEFGAHVFVGVFVKIPDGSRAGGPDAVGAAVVVEVVVAVLAAGRRSGVEVLERGSYGQLFATSVIFD